MIRIIPTSVRITSKEIAKLYKDNIWKLHRIPRKIISDRGPQFASKFMGELCKCLEIQRALSMVCHPQTDGQTEQMNQEIEAFLRHYVNYKQDNWANWIAEAEFQYNDKQHSTTGFSPFYLNYRCRPWKGDGNRSTTIPEVQRFTEKLDEAKRKAQQAIDGRNKELKTKINKGIKTKTYTNRDKV